MKRWTDWIDRRAWDSRTSKRRRKTARDTGRAGRGRRGKAYESLEARSLLTAIVTPAGSTAGFGAGAHDETVNISAAVPVNDTLLVEVAASAEAGAVTVTDSQGNAYTQDIGMTHGASGSNGGVETLIFRSTVNHALSTTDHISVSFAGGGGDAVSVLAVAGLVSVDPLDQTHADVGHSMPMDSGLTSTTTAASELLVGALGAAADNTHSFTPGLGYTAGVAAGTDLVSPLAGFNVILNPEFQVVSSTGEYDATGSLSGGAEPWAAAIATYVINVTPTVNNPGDQTSTEGDSVNLAITATNPDGQPLTWSQTGLPPGLNIDPATGVISGTAQRLSTDPAAPYNVTVTAIDPSGHSGSTSFTWTVNNVAPTATDEEFSVPQNGTLTLAAPGVLAHATDPGTPSETLTAVQDTSPSHGTLTLNSDGSFTYVPATNFEGSDSFTFHVFDGLASSAIHTVTINVGPDTTPPTFTAPLGNQSDNEGAVISLHDPATDSDGDTLIYDASGLPNGLSINPANGDITGTISGTAADQTFNTTITATDGTNTASNTFTWTVSNLPVAATGTAVTAAEGTTSGEVAVATFTDPGGPEALANYSAQIDWGDGSVSAGSVSLDASTGTFTVFGTHTYAEESAAEHPGSTPYSLTVTITDNDGTTTLTSTATSTASVSDPSVTPAGAFTVTATEGADSGMQTVATFVDPGGAEALGDYTATIDWGDGTSATAGSITLDTLTGTFTVQGSHTYAEESGTEHINSNPYLITVSIQHENSAAVTALSTATVSDPPVDATGGFTVTASRGIDSGSQTVATFTDPGGPEVVGDYSAAINWGDGSSSAGSISETGGTFTVTGDHLYASTGTDNITVTISHESAPDATATSSATVTASATLAITKAASPDPDAVGQNLTYTITVANTGDAGAADTAVSDTLPAGVTFVSASDTMGGTITHSGDTVSDSLGTLAAAASDTITVIVTPTQSGTLTNTASVTTTSPNSGSTTTASVTSTVTGVTPPPSGTCYLPGKAGDGTDATFVSNLYFELLGRAPDMDGYNYWLSYLSGNGHANSFENPREARLIGIFLGTPE